MPYKYSSAHLTPNGRPGDQSITGARSELRLSVEPIGDCRIREFKVFFRQVFERLGYKDRCKIPKTLSGIISDVSTAANSLQMAGSSVELVRCVEPNFRRENGNQIFLAEVRFRNGKRPPGKPPSGTYQGSIEHFLEVLA